MFEYLFTTWIEYFSAKLYAFSHYNGLSEFLNKIEAEYRVYLASIEEIVIFYLPGETLKDTLKLRWAIIIEEINK